MSYIQKNTSAYYIQYVYTQAQKQRLEALKKFKLNYQIAYNSIYVNINDILTDTDTNLPYNWRKVYTIHILGNIKGKISNSCFYKNKDIQNEFENLGLKLIQIHKQTIEAIETIESSHGKLKIQHSLLYTSLTPTV